MRERDEIDWLAALMDMEADRGPVEDRTPGGQFAPKGTGDQTRGKSLPAPKAESKPPSGTESAEDEPEPDEPEGQLTT